MVATSKEDIERERSTQVRDHQTANQDEPDTPFMKKFWVHTSVLYRIEAFQTSSDNCFSVY